MYHCVEAVQFSSYGVHYGLHSLCYFAKLIKSFWGKIDTIVPFQRPVGKSKLHEFVVVKELLSKLPREQRPKINDATIAIAEFQFHSVVVQVFHINHSKQFLIFHKYLF